MNVGAEIVPVILVFVAVATAAAATFLRRRRRRHSAPSGVTALREACAALLHAQVLLDFDREREFSTEENACLDRVIAVLEELLAEQGGRLRTTNTRLKLEAAAHRATKQREQGATWH